MKNNRRRGVLWDHKRSRWQTRIFFFFIFQKKKKNKADVSCELLAILENKAIKYFIGSKIHMKCQTLFSLKNKNKQKDILECYLLQILMELFMGYLTFSVS